MNTTIKITLAVIIGVAGLTAGFFVRQSIENSWGSPQEHITAALQNQIDAKTANYEFKVSASEIFSATISGISDSTDIADPKADLTVSVIIPGQAGTESMALAGQVRLEVIVADQTIFLKLKELPPVAYAMSDVSSILDTWIKFDPQELQGLTGEAATWPMPNITPEMEAKFRAFGDEMARANILKFAQAYDPETIAGQFSYHYGVRLDKETILMFLPKYFSLVKELSAQTPEAEMNQEIFDQMMSEFTNVLSQIPAEEYPTGELWISKNNLELKRIKFAKDISAADLGETRLEISADIIDINKPVRIEAPTTFISFEEAFTKVTGQEFPTELFQAQFKAASDNTVE